ncbi:MAG: serine hydrolase [Acidobacteria bacterium]|nr:serine hydrolase [Acidobacteriota bacterium]
MQSQAPIPLLIGSDFERGAAFRIRNTLSLPWNMAVGATRSEQWAGRQGRITAREAQALGVNWIFAPVVDVNNNPANPVINIRAYGEDPQLVGRLGAAFVAGAQQAGVLATAKHFPGHGDTEVDSHLSLPVIAAHRPRLEQIEWVPFREAIGAGVMTVMTAHIAVPSLEKDPRRPATLSAAILEQVLRKELGFRGLIVSDSMKMKGLTRGYWIGEAAVQAVAAGVDVLLDPPDAEVVFGALLEAVKTGRLSESRVDRSVERILQAKAWLGLSRRKRTDSPQLARRINAPAFQRQVQDLADASVTLVKDDLSQVPLDVRGIRSGHVIIVSARPSPGAAADLEGRLRARLDWLEVDRLTPEAAPSLLKQVRNRAGKADLCVVALHVPLVTGTGRLGLPPRLADWLKGLARANPSAVLISLGDPYLIRQLSSFPNFLCTFSHVSSSQRAAVKALFGEIPLAGRLPVSIPGVAERDSGLRREALPMVLGRARPDASNPSRREFRGLRTRLQRLVQSFIDLQAFPGASLAVGYREKLLVCRGYGRLDYTATSAPASLHTVFDLASLTKVVCTTTLVMQACERGVIDPDDRLSRFFPEYREGQRQHVALEHLLTHSSGLPAHVPLYKHAGGKENVLKRILETPLEHRPGSRSLYSDLGFILLGAVLERACGDSLDNLARKQIFEPLGMSRTCFHPPSDWRPRIAPTEMDPWRKRLLRGEVHDENACAMGGVAAHAGLFGTAADLAVFCQALLNGGVYNHRRIVKRTTLETFTKRQAGPRDSSRALGWDTPSPDSSAGSRLSPQSYGHTGFTGTSLWVDPRRRLFIVFLTNRVHPSRDNSTMQSARRQVADSVAEAVDRWEIMQTDLAGSDGT